MILIGIFILNNTNIGTFRMLRSITEERTQLYIQLLLKFIGEDAIMDALTLDVGVDVPP